MTKTFKKNLKKNKFNKKLIKFVILKSCENYSMAKNISVTCFQTLKEVFCPLCLKRGE